MSLSLLQYLYAMKQLFRSSLLLLVFTATSRGDDVDLQCNQNGLKLKGTLRESSCQIKGSVNDTERFGAGVRTKHGVNIIGKLMA